MTDLVNKCLKGGYYSRQMEYRFYVPYTQKKETEINVIATYRGIMVIATLIYTEEL